MEKDIEKKLELEKDSLEEQLELYKTEDPLRDPNQSSSHTNDDIITVAEGHDRITATRLELKQRLSEVRNALGKLLNGSYGKCENCKKDIEAARLMVLPTARYCMGCESKLGKPKS